MPKSKKNDESSGSDSEAEQVKTAKKSKKESKKKQSSSESDSGSEERVPVKKSKAEPKKASKSSEEENKWAIGKNKFAQLSEFKGTWYVNIREYYNCDGEMKPTKKGVMLTMEQWQKLKGYVGDIDDAIKENV